MNSRVAVAAILLVACPALTRAQEPASPTPSPAPAASPRLGLTGLKPVVRPPTPTPFRLPVPAVHKNEFARSSQQIMSCADSEALGRYDGNRVKKPWAWFFGSVGTGMATSFVSLAYMPVVAYHKQHKPNAVPPRVDAPCYLQGFAHSARLNSTWAAVLGSIVGAIVVHSLAGWS